MLSTTFVQYPLLFPSTLPICPPRLCVLPWGKAWASDAVTSIYASLLLSSWWNCVWALGRMTCMSLRLRDHMHVVSSVFLFLGGLTIVNAKNSFTLQLNIRKTATSFAMRTARNPELLACHSYAIWSALLILAIVRSLPFPVSTECSERQAWHAPWEGTNLPPTTFGQWHFKLYKTNESVVLWNSRSDKEPPSFSSQSKSHLCKYSSISNSVTMKCFQVTSTLFSISLAAAQTPAGFSPAVTKNLNLTFASNVVLPPGELIPRAGQ